MGTSQAKANYIKGQIRDSVSEMLGEYCDCLLNLR